MKPTFSKFLPAAAMCLLLSGCVVGAAVDLAATTVLTAGKLVVKGTGAVIDAAIPDKKDDDKDQKSQADKRQQTPASTNNTPQYQPVGNNNPYPAYAPNGQYPATGGSYDTYPGRYDNMSDGEQSD